MKTNLKLTELDKREMSRILGGAPGPGCSCGCTCPCACEPGPYLFEQSYSLPHQGESNVDSNAKQKGYNRNKD